MTATDEPTETLRALLDERGVNWFGSYDSNETCWDVGELTWVYGNDGNIAGLGVVQGDITPEQAIEATLGRAYEPPMAMHWDGDVLVLTLPRDPSSVHVRLFDSVLAPRKVYQAEATLERVIYENAKLRELATRLIQHIRNPPCEGCSFDMSCDQSDLTQCDEWSFMVSDARELGIGADA